MLITLQHDEEEIRRDQWRSSGDKWRSGVLITLQRDEEAGGREGRSDEISGDQELITLRHD